jgi:hypothetical protein
MSEGQERNAIVRRLNTPLTYDEVQTSFANQGDIDLTIEVCADIDDVSNVGNTGDCIDDLLIDLIFDSRARRNLQSKTITDYYVVGHVVGSPATTTGGGDHGEVILLVSVRFKVA